MFIIIFFIISPKNRSKLPQMDYSNNFFLISRLKQGDKKAFTYLIDKYHNRLCVYADSLINNHIRSEDVVQNVFIRLWEKRKNLDTAFSVKNYLYKSVYNEFIDQYRKTQSVLRIEKMYIEHLNTIVFEEGHQEEMDKIINEIQEIVNELPPRCKEVFRLSKEEGLTNIEISDHLKISVKSVEAQITRAFSTIRKKLKGKFNIFLFLMFNRIGNFNCNLRHALKG